MNVDYYYVKIDHSNFSFQGEVSSYSDHLRLLASEGDILYVPCLNVKGYDISVWGIDDILYPATKLPPSFNAKVHYEGILLSDVVRKSSGLYTCYTRSGDGYSIQRVSIVNLIVGNIYSEGMYYQSMSCCYMPYHCMPVWMVLNAY